MIANVLVSIAVSVVVSYAYSLWFMRTMTDETKDSLERMFEKGWADGYDVGVVLKDARHSTYLDDDFEIDFTAEEKPKRKRANKIRKADA